MAERRYLMDREIEVSDYDDIYKDLVREFRDWKVRDMGSSPKYDDSKVIQMVSMDGVNDGEVRLILSPELGSKKVLIVTDPTETTWEKEAYKQLTEFLNANY